MYIHFRVLDISYAYLENGHKIILSNCVGLSYVYIIFFYVMILSVHLGRPSWFPTPTDPACPGSV